MASQVWPPGLPQAPRLAELVETPPNLVVRSEMDVGPAKVRRRAVAGVTTWQMALNITRDQRALLLDFFRVTLLEGALAFDWRNPVTHAPAEFRFVGVPTIRPLSMRVSPADPYLATFVLEEFPAISNAVVVPPGAPELPAWLLTRDDVEFAAVIDPLYETAAGVFGSTTIATGGPVDLPGGIDGETGPDDGSGETGPDDGGGEVPDVGES